MHTSEYVTDIRRVNGLSQHETDRLKAVTDEFEFKASDYYLGLINWNDPEDPIRRIIIPSEAELEPWGQLDASNEAGFSVLPGVQHKYPNTALFLAGDVCAGYCRYCFRKRLFIHPEQREVLDDPDAGLAYVREHPEIDNVVITGGDGLMLSTAEIERLVSGLREIDHIGVIRIGTRALSYNPYRVLNDRELVELVRKYSLPEKRIYFMLHYSHPREITLLSAEACGKLSASGAILCNQTPLVRGVNDDPRVLADLFDRLSRIGATPYYVFICRPTVGNKPYAVPVERAYEIFETARGRSSGLGKRARLVMSHSSGKIEVVAIRGESVVFRYHRAADPADSGRIMIRARNRGAYWFDDYVKTAPARRRGADVANGGKANRSRRSPVASAVAAKRLRYDRPRRRRSR